MLLEKCNFEIYSITFRTLFYLSDSTLVETRNAIFANTKVVDL